MQVRGTLLFNNRQHWAKRSGNEEYDFPIGCFYSA